MASSSNVIIQMNNLKDLHYGSNKGKGYPCTENMMDIRESILSKAQI